RREFLSDVVTVNTIDVHIGKWPAGSKAEHQPTSRNLVQLPQSSRESDWVVLIENLDCSTEPDLAGSRQHSGYEVARRSNPSPLRTGVRSHPGFSVAKVLGLFYDLFIPIDDIGQWFIGIAARTEEEAQFHVECSFQEQAPAALLAV